MTFELTAMRRMAVAERLLPSPKAGLLALMALALVGCQDLMTNDEGEWVSAVDKTERQKSRKASSIRIGDDLFMIPSGVDDQGCEMFKPRSANNLVKTALHFRQADGGFGIARDPAICRVEMTSIGPDEEGCERYHAVPLNPDLPSLANEIVYYRTTDGRYSARKPRDGCA